MAIIDIENLNYSFDIKNKVLNNINYKLNNGEKNIIIGSNGSGKTTFLKCILGILKTYKKIKIENKYVDNLSGYTNLSANIKEALYLSGDLNVIEFLKYHMELKGKDPEKAIKLLEYFNSKDILFKNISKLSSGEDKLIHDIIAIAPEPSIIIMDEPLSNLDPFRSKLLINLINSTDKSFIITLHDLNVIKSLKATLNIMINGTLSGKIMPADKIFSMHVSKTMPEKYIMEIPVNNENIYLYEDESNENKIERLEDLLYL